MSSYMYFFVKSRNNEFLPIRECGRNNPIYQAFENYAEYEKITNLTDKSLLFIKEDLEEENEQIEAIIKKYKNIIDLVAQSNGPMEEKVEQFHELQGNISGQEDLIKENNGVIRFIDFLSYVKDAVEYYDEYDGEHYVYVGIECSSPTLEDVV